MGTSRSGGDALRRYGLLDRAPERAFDELARLAAQICDSPIAAIAFVDETREWLKAKIGLDAADSPRAGSFGAHAMAEPDLFLVPDATADERFAGHSLVTGEPRVRFYAGAPLVTGEREALGAICVMDRVPRGLRAGQEEGLRALARQVMAQLELRGARRELEESEARLRVVADSARLGFVVTDREHRGRRRFVADPFVQWTVSPDVGNLGRDPRDPRRHGLVGGGPRQAGRPRPVHGTAARAVR